MKKFTAELKDGHLIVNIDLAAYHLTEVNELLISEDEGAWVTDAPMQLIVRAYGDTAETPKAEETASA